MSETAINKRFTEVLDGLELDGAVSGFFREVRIDSIRIYKKTEKLVIKASADRLIPVQAMEQAETALSEAFSLDVEIQVRFVIDRPLSDILEEYRESILYAANSRVALSRGILDGCTWELAGDRLEIMLATKGSDILKSHGCDRIIEEIVENSFGQKITVDFHARRLDEEFKEEYNEFKENEQARIRSLLTAKEEQAARQRKKRKANTDDSGVADIVIGKNFSDSLMKMSEVTPDSGRVAICGDVLNVEFREVRGKYLCMFDMTDYTGSLTVKLFVQKDDRDIMEEHIKRGVHLKVRGDAQYDRFSKDLTVMASDIILLRKDERTDDAETKRVELHLHTQMSAMDAVTPVEKLVERAAQWGHRAIAVTDHGVVQAYPDAYSAGKKHNVKIIYGVECYLVNDEIPIVTAVGGADTEHRLTGGFVVFDIETTGLNPSRDGITEVGAVKVENGKIADRCSTFVDPGMPIPEHIT